MLAEQFRPGEDSADPSIALARSRPLEGIKVIDFGHAAAGPYCAELLSEFGATVIKVESPAGDHFRDVQGGAVYANVNRNKRCVVLDLKAAEGLEIAFRLIEQADILVESFTPGTMDALGLGYDALHTRKPELIYASISGFGQNGPNRRRPGYDVVAQAMSGLMAMTGEPGRPPVRIGSSMIDFGTGLFAAFGVMAALRQRDKDGLGAHIDASLLDTAIGWMNYWFTYFGFTGTTPTPQGSSLSLFAPYQVFATSDGSVFIGVSTDRFFTVFCETFDLQELLADERFASNATRCAHRELLSDLVQQRLRSLTTQQSLQRLERSGIPHAPVLTVAEVMQDAHVLDREVFLRMNGNDGRRQIMPRLPVRIGTLDPSAPTPAPLFGQHSREVLLELGLGVAEIEALIRRGVVVAA